MHVVWRAAAALDDLGLARCEIEPVDARMTKNNYDSFADRDTAQGRR
jgi:hypothetical protein